MAIVCLVLALVTIATYLPVRFNDFVRYDDQKYVTENPNIQHGLTWQSLTWAFTTAYSANWHPMTWVSHTLDVQLFGLNPVAHHLVNLGYHVLNTCLVFLALHGLTRALWRSAFVAALFALHPLHVESVAWLAERKDVLSAFFGLLCLWMYAGYVQALEISPKRSRLCYTAALVFFALGLLCKPMLVTLPFLFLLLDYWPLNRIKAHAATESKSGFSRPTDSTQTPPRRLLTEKLPFLALSMLSCIATLHAQAPAMSYFRRLTFAERSANALVSCLRYLEKTIWPADLAAMYPHPAHWPVLTVLLAAFSVALITVIALVFLARLPFLAVGWFWFLGMLVPVLGFVQVGAQSMADRYTYLPLIGVFIILSWGAWEVLRRWKISHWSAGAGATILLLCCALRTSSQIKIWRNTETLFTHAAAVTSGNWVAHYNLALAALRHYQDTQRTAIEAQAVHASATETRDSTQHDYLQDVVTHCRSALAARPNFSDANVTLAKALIELGQQQAALEQLEIAISMDPANAEARQNRAEVLYRTGRVPEAVEEYRTALRLRPDWDAVLNNLAWILATDRRPEVRNGAEAARLANRACILTDRTNLWLMNTLAAAYSESGQFSNAVSAGENALQLARQTQKPDLIRIAEGRLKLYRSGQPYRE